jgi:GalNAc-alpha-(1->4)-GalNAc-alpha-(1->3)-diNAcBac-PP-undecaprenol alpha-1,4-N-acetyl-D-galactosaminyltransferase
MRICGVIASLGAGGAERVMVELCAAWQARGDSVTLLTLDDGMHDFHAVPTGVQRVALDLAAQSVSAAGAIRANVTRTRTLRRALRNANADVIVSFTDRTNVLTLLAARGLHVPVVVSERVDPRRHVIGNAWEVLRRLVYPTASALVVQTESVREWGEELVSPMRVAVIPNPVRAVPAPRSDASERAPRVVAMGRLVEQKGFDLLVSAFASIADEFPEWSLDIYGDGPDRESLAGRIDTLGLASRITLAGRTSTPDDVLAGAAVFALPSRYEGFPNVLLEAMSHGCACVSSDCDSGPAELIENAQNGVLTPVNDVFSFAQGLAALMEDPVLRARLGRTATTVRERYAAARVIAAWDAVFARVRRNNRMAA